MAFMLMAQNDDGSTPSQEDLQSWADSYGLTFPVVADDNWSVGNRFEADGGIPSLTLLAPGAEVVIADGWPSNSDIEAVLP